MNNTICWLNNTFKAITYVVSLLCITFAHAELDKDVPIGWATYPKYDVENTIGGGNGEVVTAKTTTELINYAKSNEPLVIIAEGSFDGMITVEDNKTIIGAGSGAFLDGGFFMHETGNNVIIRNWEITGGNQSAPISYMEDAISISEVHHLWIDHCNLYNCTDGLVDITNASDLVTVSWVRTSDHHKVMLIQNGHERADEVDKLNVTLHHNHHLGDVRNPRIGYSDALILNNYYNGCSGYGIHLHWECRVRIQGCYFKNVGDKISQHKPGWGTTDELKMDWDGYAVLIDNMPESNYGVSSVTDPEKIFDVDTVFMYDFIVDDVDQVPNIVGNGANTGEQWSKLGAIPTPGQGAVNTTKNPILKWTKYGSQPTNKVFFGKTENPPEVTTVDGYEYQPGMLEANTVYYWKINDGKVWKFRTGTEVDPTVSVSKNSLHLSKNKYSKVVKYKKGLHNLSALFVGIEKNGNEKKLYDLCGREQVQINVKNQKSQNGTLK